jgi:alkylation response protein AidB-like acyl-CoA dehydrogenase
MQMDFSLSETQRAIRRSAYELADQEFAEDAFTWEGKYPERNAEILADHGFLGMSLPEEYGGGDATLMETLMAMEGVGEVCPDSASLIRNTNVGNVQIIAKFGSESVKKQYLPPVCEGKSSIAVAMSEPEHGSDVTGMDTEAERDGDEYVINGQKAWVSRALEADAFVTYTRLPDGNIGSVLIDSDNPGLTIGEPDINMYGDGQSELFFENLRVPIEQELVVGSDSFKEAMKTYNVNRVTSMALSWIIAKWLFEESLEYAQRREQFDQAIIEFQGVSHRLADMAIKLENSRYMIYRALSGDELPGRLLSSMTKVYVSEAMFEVAEDALQIKGAAGYVGETPESYGFRKIRGSKIAGGTPNVHRNNFMKSLLSSGLPAP